MFFLRDRTFWLVFVCTLVLTGLFFAWELGMFYPYLPTLPRPRATDTETGFTALLIFLFSLNIALFAYQRKRGTCPVGARNASAIAGTIGVVALLCPVCLLLPITALGASFSLLFLMPYVPLLRVIALVLLIASTMMLWPKKR
jgi:hypothetical protein